ncbi:calcium-binding protein P-like [Leptidea sinapis]|uniref:calcium-binding protein P-like n=1 Tax=Leptidea sinapis TaxID=189913 RepID=UPI0021C29846|nr:calcium-binding protein P-like [Leptidea sinapis]
MNPCIPPVNQYTPASESNVNGYYKQPEVSAAHKSVPPGWNDPPMMTTKPKPKQDVHQQAPITHPLFGAEPPQHVPLASTTPQFPGQVYQDQQQQYPGQQQQYPVQQQQYPGQQQQYPGQQQQYPGQQQQYPGQQQFPPQSQFNQQSQGQLPPGQGQYPGYNDQYGQYVPSPQSAYTQETESAVTKGPIPEEHAGLQTTLDQLSDQLLNSTTNAMTKRKVQDIQKKLENLYDLLRENKLSGSSLATLHACVRLAGAGEPGGALAHAAALASDVDFAAVASFLPALKMLLTLAARPH